MHGLQILFKSLAAVIRPGGFTRSLAEDDRRLELRTNRQLAEAPQEAKDDFLVEAESNIIDRATLLRRKLTRAFGLLIGAAVLGFLVRWLISPAVVLEDRGT
jgi:hypothetical protein